MYKRIWELYIQVFKKLLELLKLPQTKITKKQIFKKTHLMVLFLKKNNLSSNSHNNLSSLEVLMSAADIWRHLPSAFKCFPRKVWYFMQFNCLEVPFFSER